MTYVVVKVPEALQVAASTADCYIFYLPDLGREFIFPIAWCTPLLDPEPPGQSVVLDRENDVWQRHVDSGAWRNTTGDVRPWDQLLHPVQIIVQGSEEEGGEDVAPADE